MTNNWPCGYYIVLKRKSIVIGDKPLIAIGYKYKYQKVLSFSAKEDSSITKDVYIYASK